VHKLVSNTALVLKQKEENNIKKPTSLKQTNKFVHLKK